MTQVYLGQIMMTGYNFAQKGSAMCNGQLLPISQNSALFSLLGTYYGGNGTSNFQLPNLQGRAPVGAGTSVDPAWQPAPYVIGTVLGTENATVMASQMPAHSHAFNANTAAGTASAPLNGIFAQAAIQSGGTENIYVQGGNLVPLAPATVGMAGGNSPHQNMQPSLVINFNICTSGMYPSRN
jgi:microcystin-dependent protein